MVDHFHTHLSNMTSKTAFYELTVFDVDKPCAGMAEPSRAVIGTVRVAYEFNAETFQKLYHARHDRYPFANVRRAIPACSRTEGSDDRVFRIGCLIRMHDRKKMIIAAAE